VSGGNQRLSESHSDITMSSQMTPADRAVTIMKDARFKQARKFLKEGNYEDSIDIFASLVQYW
jgi:hypothetical protein